MNVFSSPKLKLERAYKHIKELESLTSPLSKNLYEIKVEPVFEFPRPYAIGETLVYRPTKPIAEILGLIIGDAINNFRSALDHLASGIIKEYNPSGRPHFPMSESREELITSNRYLSILDEALPGAFGLLLERLRPEGGSDELFWSFHILDNDSKHNIILPTVSAVSINNINLVSDAITMTNCGVSGDATRQINIFRTNGGPIRIQKSFNISVDLRFPEDSKFSEMNVLDTLNKIGTIVRETIDEFEKLYEINKVSQ